MNKRITAEDVQEKQNTINGILLYLSFVQKACEGKTPIQPVAGSSVMQSVLDELLDLTRQHADLQQEYIRQFSASTEQTQESE